MSHQHIYKSFIKICFLIITMSANAQQVNDSIPKDSIVYKTNYGLRLGIDLSKPIRSILQDYNSGIEIVGDYRISKKWYIAAELGNEEFTTNEDFTNSTSKGSYIKAGLNYNSYNKDRYSTANSSYDERLRFHKNSWNDKLGTTIFSKRASDEDINTLFFTNLIRSNILNNGENSLYHVISLKLTLSELEKIQEFKVNNL